MAARRGMDNGDSRNVLDAAAILAISSAAVAITPEKGSVCMMLDTIGGPSSYPSREEMLDIGWIVPPFPMYVE